MFRIREQQAGYAVRFSRWNSNGQAGMRAQDLPLRSRSQSRMEASRTPRSPLPDVLAPCALHSRAPARETRAPATLGPLGTTGAGQEPLELWGATE